MMGYEMDSLSKTPQLIHENTVDGDKEKGRKVSKKLLINKLNYINFQDSTILIHLRHKKFNNTISLHAKPQPCLGNQLDCCWEETSGIKQKLKSHTVQSFFVNDGQKLIFANADVVAINEEEISFHLPEISYEVSSRKVKRHASSNVKAQLIQNSALFHGSLVDFSSVSFRVDVTTIPPQTFQWINPGSPVNLIFSDCHEALYTGECRIIKQSYGQITRTFVLEPLNNQIRRFSPKESRSRRHKLVPSPNIIFRHPLTGKMVDLEVVDLSGSGCSVEENMDSSVLLPGMIIPELELSFANSFKMKCKTQVIYKNHHETDTDNRVKCGLAILDMNIEDHVRLLSLLNHAKDSRSYICNKVDMDALWKFFFETGFVYPKKYASIQTNKQKLKETYEKLYTQNPHIARHFVYQNKGVISGHMAMLRFFENTWLIQHHAASKTDTTSAGLSVLNQLSRSIIDSNNLYSSHMKYVSCYFRPENKFPNRIFGGVARYLNDQKACSLDNFAYFRYRRALNNNWDLAGQWELTKTQYDDLIELENYYENESGGLLIQAMDLEPSMVNLNNLSTEYHKLGFKRERHLLSVKMNNSIKAIIIVYISDTGLNMSELTNCVKLIILDRDKLTLNSIYTMLSIISVKFNWPEFPVLLFNLNYTEQYNIVYQNIYTLFIIDTQFSDPYFKYLNNLFKFTNTHKSC